jgi:uncharacterized protein YdaU (DUF1376 family)
MNPTSSSTKLWIPIYVADYLADTGRLTTEQHGAYLLLIFDYWRNGALPDDDATLARVCRLSSDAWSMHSASLRSFFVKADDGLLHHKRIDAEIAKAQLNRAVSVIRAKKAAQARWGKDAPSIAPGTPQALLVQCPSPSPALKTKAISSSDDESPTARSLKDAAEVQALQDVFAYYLDRVGRKPGSYTLTPTRKQKGLARLRECLNRSQGDLPAAVALQKAAIDGICKSDWHMGRDAKTNGKRYVEWESHLFASVESLEKWLEASTSSRPVENPKTRYTDPRTAYSGSEYTSEAA